MDVFLESAPAPVTTLASGANVAGAVMKVSVIQVSPNKGAPVQPSAEFTEPPIAGGS